MERWLYKMDVSRVALLFALGQSNETLCKVILRGSHESSAARREFEKHHQISHNYKVRKPSSFLRSIGLNVIFPMMYNLSWIIFSPSIANMGSRERSVNVGIRCAYGVPEGPNCKLYIRDVGMTWKFTWLGNFVPQGQNMKYGAVQKWTQQRGSVGGFKKCWRHAEVVGGWVFEKLSSADTVKKLEFPWIIPAPSEPFRKTPHLLILLPWLDLP